MADLGLQSFTKLYPMVIKKYQDLVVDQNANEADKINSIIQKLNALGKLSNDVVRDWNTVYQWAMNDGLSQDVSNKVEEMKANGELNTVLQGVFLALAGDMTTLHTSAKNTLVNSINEVDDLAKANQTAITTNTANIATNTANIATNTTNIASNTSALAQKAQQSDVADIITLKPNGTDDTANINNLISSLSASGGGIVRLTNGTYRYSQIKLKTNVYIKGNKDSTILKPLAGISTPSIILNDDSVYNIGLMDLNIDGDKANNTCSDLIYLNRTTLSGGSYDTHPRLENLKIHDGYGNGLTINQNTREGRFHNLIIYNCNGLGLYNQAGSDNHFSFITCYNDIQGGVADWGSSNHFTNVKCFGNGNASNRVPGFLIRSNTTTYVNCEAQENWGHGFSLQYCNNANLIGVMASSNGINSNTQTVNSDLAYNGYELNTATNCIIIGTAYDFRNAQFGAKTQNIGVHVGSACDGNSIKLFSTYQQINVQADTDKPSNEIVVNSQKYYGAQMSAVGTDNMLNFPNINDHTKKHIRIGELASDNAFRIEVYDNTTGAWVGIPFKVGTDFKTTVGISGKSLAFFGGNGSTQQTASADATDLASAITLVNNLKSILRSLGLCL